MRVEFHRQLEELTADLAAMCELACVGMDHATRGLLNSDLEATDQAIAVPGKLRRCYVDVEGRALLLLARQAPVAGDLRTVLAAVQIAADADRMGGLAAHVARLARRHHPSPAIPDDMRHLFAEMGRIACGLAEAAGEAIVLDDPVRADRLGQADEAMDELHRALFERVMQHGCRYDAATAADLVLLGRFYERFGDHAVEIARRVIFRSTGTLRV